MPKLLPRWRRRTDTGRADTVPARGTSTEHARLSATLPGVFGREPLLRIDVDVETRRDTDGETLRITAQLDGHVHAPPAPALTPPPYEGGRSNWRRRHASAALSNAWRGIRWCAKA